MFRFVEALASPIRLKLPARSSQPEPRHDHEQVSHGGGAHERAAAGDPAAWAGGRNRSRHAGICPWPRRKQHIGRSPALSAPERPGIASSYSERGRTIGWRQRPIVWRARASAYPAGNLWAMITTPQHAQRRHGAVGQPHRRRRATAAAERGRCPESAGGHAQAAVARAPPVPKATGRHRYWRSWHRRPRHRRSPGRATRPVRRVASHQPASMAISAIPPSPPVFARGSHAQRHDRAPEGTSTSALQRIRGDARRYERPGIRKPKKRYSFQCSTDEADRRRKANIARRKRSCSSWARFGQSATEPPAFDRSASIAELAIETEGNNITFQMNIGPSDTWFVRATPPRHIRKKCYIVTSGDMKSKRRGASNRSGLSYGWQ